MKTRPFDSWGRGLRSSIPFLTSFLLVMFSAALHAQKPDRSRLPILGPPPSLKLASIQHLKLSNGLPVILMEKHEVPLVQIELIVMTGSASDPTDKSGLARMATSMMEEGAGSRNALELADAIDFLGASINAFAGQHTSRVEVHTPLSKLDSALTLFGDVALHPTFPAEELERNRKERLTALMQWRDEPSQIASVLFNRTLFGTSHPYGMPPDGSERSLRSLHIDELRKFHRTFFRANNARLIVVGDVTPKLILPKLEQIFSKWESGKLDQLTFPEAEQVHDRRIYLVDKPGAPQSVVRIGRIGARRLTEDYYSLLVMNTILGGSFTSRLNQNLREQHGYTYGAGSAFDFLPMPGAFRAAASVQTDVTGKALAEFMKELERILQPVADEELTRAKSYLTLRYPENFQSVAQIAGQISDLVLYNLPDDYFDNYSQHILAVTKDDVHRVAEKYLDPKRVAIIIVGDRKQIEKGISVLNLGQVSYLTVDDVLGVAPLVPEDKGR